MGAQSQPAAERFLYRDNVQLRGSAPATQIWLSRSAAAAQAARHCHDPPLVCAAGASHPNVLGILHKGGPHRRVSPPMTTKGFSGSRLPLTQSSWKLLQSLDKSSHGGILMRFFAWINCLRIREEHRDELCSD